MTIASLGREATLDDLYRIDGKAELVSGNLILMAPTGFQPGRAAGRIYRSLDDHEREHGAGFAIPDNVGFIVQAPYQRSFSPDAAWYVGPPTGGRFIQSAPVFAAEVRSEGDYGLAAERAMAAKRADYFAAGTQVVWDVDVLREEVVRVYRADSPDQATVYRRGEMAEAEPAVPGWKMPVEELF